MCLHFLPKRPVWPKELNHTYLRFKNTLKYKLRGKINLVFFPGKPMPEFLHKPCKANTWITTRFSWHHSSFCSHFQLIPHLLTYQTSCCPQSSQYFLSHIWFNSSWPDAKILTSLSLQLHPPSLWEGLMCNIYQSTALEIEVTHANPSIFTEHLCLIYFTGYYRI